MIRCNLYRCALMAMLLLFIHATSAKADLVLVSVTDTLDEFHLIIDWNHTPSSFVHNGSNWFASVNISGGPQIWHQEAIVRHVTDPHPGLGESGGGTPLVGIVDFPDNVGPLSLTFTVPHGSHVDRYTHALIPLPSGLLRTDLQGTHVPEPSTYLLFGTSLLGVLGYIRQRRKRRA